jgi:hypothetical protein
VLPGNNFTWRRHEFIAELATHVRNSKVLCWHAVF